MSRVYVCICIYYIRMLKKLEETKMRPIGTLSTCLSSRAILYPSNGESRSSVDFSTIHYEFHNSISNDCSSMCLDDITVSTTFLTLQ